MTMPWAELMRDVSELRRAFTSDYAFQPDAIVACLEAQQLSTPRPEPGLVVKLLCGANSPVAKPAVPWATLYQCYGSADRCGPLMKSLWEGSRPLLGSAARQRLHLIAGLGVLLSDWLEESRAPTADRALLPAFAAATRRLGVSADLQRMLSELDAVEALVSDDRPLAQSTDLQRRTLRRLLQELSAIGQY